MQLKGERVRGVGEIMGGEEDETVDRKTVLRRKLLSQFLLMNPLLNRATRVRCCRFVLLWKPTTPQCKPSYTIPSQCHWISPGLTVLVFVLNARFYTDALSNLVTVVKPTWNINWIYFYCCCLVSRCHFYWLELYLKNVITMKTIQNLEIF